VPLDETQGRLRGKIRWAALASLAVALLVFIERRGPIRLAAPRTVYSNGHPAQRYWEPYLLFLSDVRTVVPAGVRVLVLPARGSNDLIPFFYTAIGQLPAQRIVPPVVEFREAEPADYVASYEGECRAPGYRELRRWSSGTLCERAD
jgi:hypothetical protein